MTMPRSALCIRYTEGTYKSQFLLDSGNHIDVVIMTKLIKFFQDFYKSCHTASVVHAFSGYAVVQEAPGEG